MTKVQKADPGLPSRSDTFLRMLDLEKRYKMQRIQGHDPATIISPSTSSSSAQPNRPFKARRASGHPPLSHQTQIMKAVRRSSGLPSLSISIPPAPAEDPAVGTDGLPGEQQPKKEERTKTVTFTGPGEEEEDNDDDGASSDQSSICQSPSWEQYGRKKKKKPKKRDADQSKKSEEKSANTSKKKGNRLSKVPPSHVQGTESLVTADRSRSAPELNFFPKSNSANPDTPDSNQSGEMANQKLDSKPKSKGFLSGFRLQHGNVSAVQKLIDNQRMSSDGNRPADPNARKPPSIISAMSNSTRSASSLDQRPPSARNSSGSSHGRSQSLLSSTLSKLKGPSYLYYRPAEMGEGIQFKRPSSSHEPDLASGWLNDQPAKRPSEQKPERPKERPISSIELAQQASEHSIPPRPKRADTQPAPDAVSRNVPAQARLDESKNIGTGYESPDPTSYRGRRSQIPQTRVPARETAVEKEKRPRAERVARAPPRQPIEYVMNGDYHSVQSAQVVQKVEQQYYLSRQANGHVQPQAEVWVEARHAPESAPSRHREHMEANNERSNHVEAGFSRDEEDDQGSIGTHTSTIRPVSRRQGRSPPPTDARKHVTFPPSPNGIGRAVTSDPTEEEIHETDMEPQNPEQPAEMEEIGLPAKPLRLDRSADYFTFVSQSYAPPSLELRSPLEGKFPSPRIDEEPEEEDDLDHILRHIPVRKVNEIALPPEIVHQAILSNPNIASRVMRQKPPKNSPSISLSSHYSDSDVPAFERLGISPKAARILAGTETSSTSTSQSNTDPSRTSSERSSSSTCDDTPPSPAVAPIPDGSQLRAQREAALPQKNTVGRTPARPSTSSDERTPRRNYRPPAVEPASKDTSRSTSRDVGMQDESWSRTALPIDLENELTPASKLNDLASTPPLVASPTSASFSEDNKEGFDENELASRSPYQQALPPRAQSALDIHSMSFLPDLKHQPLQPKKAKGAISSSSLPSSPPSEPADGAPRKSALRASRKNSANSEESSALISPGAAYLQEARKAAPALPAATSRALRPHYTHKNSSTSIKSAAGSDGRSDPLAKMLVECCSCKFFHDMPSRVYECMAKPDSLVEDKLLGVSATITTMVKCPWCGHGMSTQCCSGYAAVVYLKEKLHGK